MIGGNNFSFLTIYVSAERIPFVVFVLSDDVVDNDNV